LEGQLAGPDTFTGVASRKRTFDSSLPHHNIMKSLLVLLITAFSLFGQGDEELVTVKKKYVSAAGVSEATVATKANTVSQYVGLSKEIGMAMREGLSALTDETDKFSKTDAGRFVMFLVAYKVIGVDLIQFVFGGLLLFVGVIVWIYAFLRHCFPRTVLKSEKILENKTKERVYETINTGRGEAQIAYGIALAIWCVICSLVIFT